MPDAVQVSCLGRTGRCRRCECIGDAGEAGGDVAETLDDHDIAELHLIQSCREHERSLDDDDDAVDVITCGADMDELGLQDFDLWRIR